jgi:hypothetical protein
MNINPEVQESLSEFCQESIAFLKQLRGSLFAAETVVSELPHRVLDPETLAYSQERSGDLLNPEA